jgi:hypothetical protein
MKHIRKINESFEHHWNKKDDIISSIWGITEDEIFDAISDVEDEHDVKIKCDFFLQSRKGQKFHLESDPNFLANDERMEAYAAAGFLPIIGIYIETSQDIRYIQSTLMDSLKNLNDWFLFDVSKSTPEKLRYTPIPKQSLKIYLTQENPESDFKSREIYHKRINAFFNEFFPEFKKHRYRVLINKSFEKDGKFFIKHPNGPVFQVKKLYSIVLEKIYNVNLDMIDELFEMKKCFNTCLSKLSEIEDFYDVSYDFEMTNLTSEDEKKTDVIFTIAVYEK